MCENWSSEPSSPSCWPGRALLCAGQPPIERSPSPCVARMEIPGMDPIPAQGQCQAQAPAARATTRGTVSGQGVVQGKVQAKEEWNEEE